MARTVKKHDVFISFRGEDTRTNFTSHLHSALCRKGIKAYIDNYLEKGEDVWPALSQAIQESHSAVVVFSKNYASSKWCLKELLNILECREKEGQIVIPVFCEVDPSDIRNQTGTFEEAFGKHIRELSSDRDNSEEYVNKTLSEWKTALTVAANISGRDTRSREYKNDSEVIDKIVEDVLQKLDLRFPNELDVKNLIRFENICEDVKLLLSKNDSEKVQIVGIWGMGGIGKTTIAKALFSELLPHYDSVCFMENVREASQNIGQSKLTSLREKLLHELLKDEHINSPTFTQRRLSSKKILVVLDDVDNSEQLEVLCEECSYGGPGSKVIITTRNKSLLNGTVEDGDVYPVEPWSSEKSLELFCLSAFKSKHPEKGYEDLSNRAVHYAGGVPLALKVLGSYLRGGKTTKFWESELNKFKDYIDDRIQKVLRVSYDGLDVTQKNIFLDIAFFFKGENKDFVEKILNACGFHSTSGLKVLEDKALITISNGNKIQMHDLVQDMGLNIVRSIQDSAKRSRLKDIEEITDVLEFRNKGSAAIEGIKLDMSQIEDLCLNADAFSMMTSLRFLQLHIPSGKTSGNMTYPRVLNKFSAKLRYFEWNGYHFKSLPETFFTKMLVEIRMPHSDITEIWHGVKNVQNLEGIDLSECKKLENFPDLSKSSKLKWLNLSGCESLLELHPSVLSLDTLETLILDGCKRLRSLKSDKHLKSLSKISVNGCSSLKEFSVSSQKMESLELNYAGIEKLHSSIGLSSKLRLLNLEGLKLRSLPDDLSRLQVLQELRISNCKFLVLDIQNLHTLFNGLRSLKLLHLEDCHNLSQLPDNIIVLSYLCELRLDGSRIETLPAGIKHLSNLEILSLENCKNLKHLPELPTLIKEFRAVNCTSLMALSTLDSFATVMKGKEKYISFENCMKLDGPSLYLIMESAQLSAMNAIFQNMFIIKNNGRKHGLHNYNFVKFCSPGSRVPEQFKHRSEKSSFTIDLPSLSNMLGMVMCAVLSPSDEIKKHGAKIFCQFYTSDGRKLGYATRWYHEAIRELSGDHVFLWYDALHFDSTVRDHEQQVTVEFYVTNDLGERDVLNVFTKECGVRLVFDSELPDLLRELDLDFESKWQLGEELSQLLTLKLGPELRSELESKHRSALADSCRKPTEGIEIVVVQEVHSGGDTAPPTKPTRLWCCLLLLIIVPVLIWLLWTSFFSQNSLKTLATDLRDGFLILQDTIGGSFLALVGSRR